MDRFRDTILLESTDFHAGENSYSTIGIQARAGIEITNQHTIEFKLPGLPVEKALLKEAGDLATVMRSFRNWFEMSSTFAKIYLWD